MLLLVVISLAFAWLLWPYYGAVLWGTILAVLFEPVHVGLLRRTGERPTWAALTTLLLIVLIVVLPLLLLTGTLVRETALVYERVQNGELSIARYFEQMIAALPAWISDAAAAARHRRPGSAGAEAAGRVDPQAARRSRRRRSASVRTRSNSSSSFFIMLYLRSSCCATARR